jgi:hypothetical protein
MEMELRDEDSLDATLLTIDEAASVCGLTVSQLRMKIYKDEMPNLVRRGKRRVFIRRADAMRMAIVEEIKKDMRRFDR